MPLTVICADAEITPPRQSRTREHAFKNCAWNMLNRYHETMAFHSRKRHFGHQPKRKALIDTVAVAYPSIRGGGQFAIRQEPRVVTRHRGLNATDVLMPFDLDLL